VAAQADVPGGWVSRPDSAAGGLIDGGPVSRPYVSTVEPEPPPFGPAGEADGRAGEADGRAGEADGRAGEADGRAGEAEGPAGEAEGLGRPAGEADGRGGLPVGAESPTGTEGSTYSGAVPPLPGPESPYGSAFPLMEPPMPPTGEPPRRERRRTIILAAVAGLAVGAVVAIVITLTGSNGSTATATPTPTGGRSAAPTGGATTGAATTGGATTGGATPSGGTAGESQQVTGPRGLTASVPANWTLAPGSNGAQVATDPNHPSNSATFAATAAASGPLLAEVQAMERELQADPKVSGYARLLFRTTRYGNADAAVEWGYRYTRDGQEQQTAVRVWRINGTDYTMSVNSLVPDFQQVRRVFELMLGSASPR
jgi:hypothetical protein